jgi:4-hydroxy-tetrahydrodipicolinate synthase
MQIFSGSFVALITPFNHQKKIDFKVLEQLIEWHIQEGTDGIICCGTTGEGLALSDGERKKIAESCIRIAQKRIPILISTGTSDTRQSVRLTEKMYQLGIDGTLVVTPYYNKPSQKGCIAHFREIAKVGLPMIVYHNPGRAVVQLTAETIAEIGEMKGVVAIKESSHNLELVKEIRKISKIPIFSGEDDLTYSIIEEGGIGSISVIGNLIPRGWSQMIHLALAQKKEAAAKLMDRYRSLCKALFLETNPQCVKWAMEWLGKAKGELRLPLLPPEVSTQVELKRALVDLSLPYLKLNRQNLNR